MKCTEHPDVAAEYFCSSHAVPVCANCAVFEHEDCDINDLYVYEHQTRLISEVQQNVRQLQLVDKSATDKIRMHSKQTKYERAQKDAIDTDQRIEFLKKCHDWYSELIGEANICLEAMKLRKGQQSVESKEAEDLLIQINRKLIICLDKNVRDGAEHYTGKVSLLFRDCDKPVQKSGGDNRHPNEIKGWIKQAEHISESDVSDDVGSPRSLLSFSAWSSNDEKFCFISGMQFLLNNNLVLADSNNLKLKLFSPAFQMVKDVTVPSSPFDITQLTNKNIAVSFPKECMIRLYSEELEEMSKTISTDQPCLGVSSLEDFLYVFCQSTWASTDCINVYGDSGYLHANIPTNYCGARYISAIPWSDGVVFTQTTKDKKTCLSCITPSKNQIWNEPLQNASDNIHGVILVNKTIVFCTSQRVCHFRHKGKVLGTLLGPENVKWPRALAVSPDKTQLAISQVSPFFDCQDNNMVLVLQFS